MFTIEDTFYLFTGSYHDFFGEYSMRYVTDLAEQKKYDREITAKGQTLTIEEKARKQYRSDILLEWKCGVRPGWIGLTEARYLAYGFESNKIVYLLSMPDLQNFWFANEAHLKETYFTSSVYNSWNDYTSYFTCLPIYLLRAEGIRLQRLR